MGNVFRVFVCMRDQWFLTLHGPMDCSLSGSVHGIPQARILEWAAIFLTQGRSGSPASPALVDGRFTTEPPGKPVVSILIRVY